MTFSISTLCAPVIIKISLIPVFAKTDITCSSTVVSPHCSSIFGTPMRLDSPAARMIAEIIASRRRVTVDNDPVYPRRAGVDHRARVNIRQSIYEKSPARRHPLLLPTNPERSSGRIRPDLPFDPSQEEQ